MCCPKRRSSIGTARCSSERGRHSVSRGGKCGEMDEALLPRHRGQSCEIAVVRLGVQPGQLSTATGSAASHEDLDDDDLAGEVDQDRGQSGSACQVRNLPDGGGGGLVSAVPSDHRTDTATRRDADPTSANVMVTDAPQSRTNQEGPAMSVRTIWATDVPSRLPERHFGCGHDLSHLFPARSTTQFRIGFLAGAATVGA